MLSSSPDALPSDQYLAHLIKLDHIAEDTATLLRMEEPSHNRSLTNMTVSYDFITYLAF